MNLNSSWAVCITLAGKVIFGVVNSLVGRVGSDEIVSRLLFESVIGIVSNLFALEAIDVCETVLNNVVCGWLVVVSMVRPFNFCVVVNVDEDIACVLVDDNCVIDADDVDAMMSDDYFHVHSRAELVDGNNCFVFWFFDLFFCCCDFRRMN